MTESHPVHKLYTPCTYRGAAFALALAAYPSVGLTQSQVFTLPAECEAYVTVQSKDCSVSHHFTCEGDPEGHQRRADLDEEQMTYVGTIDAETQWIESFHMLSGHTERLEANPRDRASFSELLSTGRNEWDFQTESPQIGVTRYAGFDELTGEEVVIDGVTLLRTRYEITAYAEDGSVIWSGQGNEYISADWRMFLSGQSSYITSDDEFSTDGQPVEFLFPGDAGFLSVNPKYGCGEMVSMLELPHG